MPDRRQAQDTALGERIRALEVQVEMHTKAVAEKLDKGEVGFDKLRETLEGLKKVVTDTHADCLRAADLEDVRNKVRRLESIAAKTMKWGGIGSVIFGAVLTVLTLFGPNRVAEAWVQLWK